MSFAHPILAALGVLAVAIPIILHLLRRKKKPVSWGAMRFILEAQKRTRRRLTIDELILLIARCLLIGLAGLAIARPILSGTGPLGSTLPTTLAIVIDNSLTSGVSSGDGTELDLHVAEALSLLDSLDPTQGDRASLVLAASPAQAVIAEPTSELDAIRRQLEQLEPVSSRADLPRAVQLASDSLPSAESDRRVLSVFSGFRSGSLDRSAAMLGNAADRVIAPVPATTEAPNITVRAVQPLRRVSVPGDPGAGAVRAVLGRSGSTSELDVEVSLSLLSPGGLPLELTTGVVRFASGMDTAQATIPLALPDEPAPGSALRLTVPRDALAGDNTAFWPIDARERLRVGIIADTTKERTVSIADFDAGAWLGLALAPDPETGASIEQRTLSARSVSAPLLRGLDAVFLTSPGRVDAPGWEALGAFVDQGGLLVVAPEPGDEPQLWIDALARVTDLPWTTSRQAVQPDASVSISLGTSPGFLLPIAEEMTALLSSVSLERWLELDIGGYGTVPLVTESGSPLLAMAQPQREGSLGLVAVWAMPPVLSWTDLPAKPAMIPLVQELLREGIADAGSEPIRIAGQPLRLPAGVIDLDPLDAESGADGSQTQLAGLYQMLAQGGQPRGVLGINPDADAGSTAVEDRDSISAWLTPIAPGQAVGWTNAQEQDQSAQVNDEGGTPIATLLLSLAALAALIEVYYAWRTSTSGRKKRLVGSVA